MASVESVYLQSTHLLTLCMQSNVTIMAQNISENNYSNALSVLSSHDFKCLLQPIQNGTLARWLSLVGTWKATKKQIRWVW